MSMQQPLNVAIALHRAGRLEEAERQYQDVLDRVPEHAVANQNFGILLVQSGRLLRALEHFERAVRGAPESAECQRSLANCLFLLGKWEEALAMIDEAAAAGKVDDYLAALRKGMVGEAGGRKVFCIGRNKTATTSIQVALQSFGLRVGLQARGERLRDDWAKRDFRRILGLCRTADAFQDAPFSQPFTFQAVDAGFPGSKFILTVRGSAEQWFDSLLRFHTRIIGKGRVPTADDLRDFEYRYRGYLWDSFVASFGDDERLLYDRDTYIASYLDYNRSVTEYFRHRPEDLLVLNVGEPDSMQRLCEFLGVPHRGQVMPHVNRTA